MEAIKDFLRSICRPIGQALGLTTLQVGYIGLGVIALLLILLIVIIVVCTKKHKKKKETNQINLAKKEAEEKAEKEADIKAEETEEPVKAETEPVEEEKPVEEVKEEISAEPETVAEEPVEAEEPVKEEPVKAEEKVEETPVVAEEKVENTEPEKEEKAEPKKKPVAKKTTTAKKSKSKVHMGKWNITVRGKEEFIACLYASNGEKMLASEIYATEESARNGIATIVKAVETGSFVIYQDKSKNYYYKLKSTNNRLVCVGEIYKSKEQCESAVESIKRIAKDSSIEKGLTAGDPYVPYTPAEIDEEELKKGQRGKWKLEKTTDGKFTCKLYASNGQLMLSTEEVASKKTALNSLEAVRKYAQEGNFIIDKDKFGRYYYKLRNSQKSVICIGEAYATPDSCTKAIESVRRFSINAGDVEE